MTTARLVSNPDAKVLSCGPSPRGWHRLQTAAECLQKYAWDYVSDAKTGRPTKQDSKSPALMKGSLIHLALAQFYVRMQWRQEGRDESEWCYPEEAVELMAKVDGVPELIDTVIQTFQAYERKYFYDDQMWKVVGVEQLGLTYIKGKYLLTGRRDLIVEDNAGQIWVVDHKTTARLTAKHKQFYGVSGQLLGYDLMARQQYKEKYAGLILNLVEVGGNNLDRVQLPRSPNLEAQFENMVVDIEQAIERLEAENRPRDQWPKAMSELTCFTRYGACPHLDQCRFGAGAGKAGNWTWENDI